MSNLRGGVCHPDSVARRKTFERRLVWPWWVFRHALTVLRVCGIAAIAMICSGCVSWTSIDGTRHTLVLGIGLVSIKTNPDNSATAIRSHALGLAIQPMGSNPGLMLGYQEVQEALISSEWQGIVEVNAVPGQPLRIEGLKVDPQPVLPAATAEK